MIGNFILRLTIWLLLTANWSLENLIIGIVITCLLPHNRAQPERLRDILRGLGKILIAIPQAYLEAVALIFSSHNREEIIMEQIRNRRSSGQIFLDIFLITFTPKTIVLNYHEDGWYEVHHVLPGKRP
jgi:multicomponent Na+:H+ antiporter subunit E